MNAPAVPPALTAQAQDPIEVRLQLELINTDRYTVVAKQSDTWISIDQVQQLIHALEICRGYPLCIILAARLRTLLASLPAGLTPTP